MNAYLHSRLREWGNYFAGGTGHLGYGSNPIASMSQGSGGGSSEASLSAMLMDKYIRHLMNRRSNVHRDVVLMEAGVYASGADSQRHRARMLRMSHQTYRNYLGQAEGFLEGCLSAE